MSENIETPVQGQGVVQNYVNQMNTAETTSTETSTPAIVEETVVETPENGTAEIVENTSSTEAFDVSKFLAESSEGLIPDVDSLKANLPKIKEYDSLLSQKAELEEKLKADPFVNEFTKSLDTYIRSGKSTDEIENFIKLSRMDIDAMEPKDVKVMALVNKGYSPEIANQIVERDFPLHKEDLDESEKAIIAEELRVSSLEDRQALKALKKEITTVDNSANEQKETARLQEIANNTEFEKNVKASVPAIVSKITGLGELNLNGKEGDEAIKLNFDLPDDFKALIPAKVESIFLTSKLEINDENIAFANKLIQAEYLQDNFETIAQSISKHVEALITEKMVNKYENRSGLPPESTNPIVENTDQAKADFLSKVAKSRS